MPPNGQTAYCYCSGLVVVHIIIIIKQKKLYNMLIISHYRTCRLTLKHTLPPRRVFTFDPRRLLYPRVLPSVSAPSSEESPPPPCLRANQLRAGFLPRRCCSCPPTCRHAHACMRTHTSAHTRWVAVGGVYTCPGARDLGGVPATVEGRMKCMRDKEQRKVKQKR